MLNQIMTNIKIARQAILSGYFFWCACRRTFLIGESPEYAQ